MANGRKLAQKLIDAKANTKVVKKSFDADMGAGKHRRTILNVGAYRDC